MCSTAQHGRRTRLHKVLNQHPTLFEVVTNRKKSSVGPPAKRPKVNLPRLRNTLHDQLELQYVVPRIETARLRPF
eukprot:213604-Chlamydomonas_euryale.AAC.14